MTAPTFLDLGTEVMVLREQQGLRGHDRDLSRWRVHVGVAPFANKRVDKIKPKELRAWLREMMVKPALTSGAPKALDRATISRCLSLASAIFLEAVERELIELNPCVGVKPKKRVGEGDTVDKWAFLTPDEQVAIATCEAIPLEHRLMIRFAIGTGLRQSEQRYLELADLVVDGDAPFVHVRIAGRSKTGAALPPKSGKRRKVPLFGDGLAAAREWLAFLPTFCPENPQGLVFPNVKGLVRSPGKPLGSVSVRRHYKSAGVALRPGLHWHALRHTFASNLVSGAFVRRWTLEEIRVLMGHSSTAVTERYSHVSDMAIQRAVAETVAANAPAAPELPLPPLAEDTLRDLQAAIEAPATDVEIPVAPDTEREVA